MNLQAETNPRRKPEAHLRERPFRASTEASYRYHVDHALLKFRGRPVADIKRTEVRDLYEELKLKRGNTSAGGAMRVLRALINTAMRIDETIPANPCSALRISAPPTRQVDMLDIPAWWADTEKLLPMRRDLHRAMLLTGARRTSILTVRRTDVDLERKVLTFQHMKIGPPMAFPMGTQLTEMLRQRLDEDESLGSEWLWPSGRNSSGRTVDPRARGHEDLPSAH